MPNVPTTLQNPGDLKDPSTGQLRNFSDPVEGKAALYNDLTSKMTGTSSTGIGPNSSLLDFSKTYAPASDKNDPIQYAANLANQLKVSPDTPIGTLLPRIDDFANAVSHNEGYQPSGNNSFSNQSPETTFQPQQITSDGKPFVPSSASGVLNNVGNAIKGVGNFLFPIVGDVYHDVKGDNTKTALQQTGDAALSALPFIPGLGEAGEAVKGTEATLEGGADVAKSTGLLGKTLKGAGVGYGAGVASNLSQGQGIGQALTPNANNLIGGLLGGATPLAMKGLGTAAKAISGIDPQVEGALTHLGREGNPQDVPLAQDYLDKAKSFSTNVLSPKGGALASAGEAVDQAGEKLNNNISEAGAQKGAILKANINTPIKQEGIVNVAKNFAQQIADKFKLNLVSDAEGNVSAIPLEGSMRTVAPSEISRIENIATQFNKLFSMGEKANVGQASDIISNLDEATDYSRADNYGHTNDPLQSLIQSTRGGVNRIVRDAAPDLAAANDRYSGLKDLQGELGTMAGKNLQKGELLMKRLFSGDKSGDVQDLFGKLKQETGIDLSKHGVLSKYAIDAVGGKSEKSLLQKAIEEGVSNGTGGGGLFQTAKNVSVAAAKKLGANQERVGLNALSGKVGPVGSGLITKGAIEAGRGVKGLLEKF